MKKFLLSLLAIVAMVGSVWAAGKGVPLQLAKGGKPCAEIVIPANADVTLKFAAEELQLWISKISGAKLPLVKAEKQNVNQIVLDPAASRFPADAEALKGNDGYSVRSAAGKVYLNGSCPKGILNGVFRMLYKNSDIIWARPHRRSGIFYTANPNFTLTNTDYIDIPKFLLRGWQFNKSKAGNASNLWQVRNGCNWDFLNPAEAEKRKFGSAMEYGGGHNIIQVYMPEAKYFAKHPDFYSMINGKRVHPSSQPLLTQLCFTNEKMNEAFLREVITRVKANPQFDTFRILAEDNYRNCCCPECVKPIKLEDGTLVEYSDPAFRSTRFFIFLNRIARHFKENYPGKRVLTYAYFFTVIPPKCLVEDNIDVIFCPIEKNSKFALDVPENESSEKNYLGWVKVAPKSITWRDYYGLCSDFPRPIDRVAFADYRYIYNHGTRRTYTEMAGDGGKNSKSSIWDCNSVYFWTMTQACWDPFQDLDTLRKEFFTRVYGEAAADVAEYYKLIEKEWYKLPGHSRWNDYAIEHWCKYVYRTGIESACRAALERAASRNISKIRKGLIADLRKNFEKNIHAARERDIAIPRVNARVKFDASFKTAEWKQAVKIEKFQIRNKQKDPERTVIYLLGDKRNLYIGIDAQVSGERLKKFLAGNKNTKRLFSHRELFDIIIHGNWCNRIDYIRFFVDPAGNAFSRGRAVGVKAQTKVGKSSWQAMVTIPWQGLAIDPDKDSSFRMQVVRHRLSPGVKSLVFSPNSVSKYSIMLGGKYDQKPAFCECRIGK